MLGIHDYWLFVVTGVLLNLAPGQDTLFILGSSIAYGRRIGLASALGICTGCIVHTLGAALGLSAILATSSGAFTAIKLAGAAYLIYLGIRALTARSAPATSLANAVVPSAALAFRRGVITNVLNNLSVSLKVQNNNIAVQVCAAVDLINTIISEQLSCAISQR